MSQVYETPAILIRQIDLPGEDRLGVFFTREYGKRTLLLKGVKKSQAKLQYRLREGEVREIEFVRGRNSDRLTAIHQERFFEYHPQNLILIDWVCTFIDTLIVDEGEDVDIYDWAEIAILAIQEVSKEEQVSFVSWMLIRGLSLLGYGLDVSQCVMTGAKRSSEFYIAVDAGGLIVKDVVVHHPQSVRLTKEDIQVIRRYQRGEYCHHQLPITMIQQYASWYGLPLPYEYTR